MFVYRIINLENDKVYIGKTSGSVAKRWKKHISNARQGVSHAIYRAIRAHGAHCFNVDTLSQHKTPEELSIAEIASIYIHKSNDGIHGYNMTDGGEGCLGKKHSEQSRKIIGDRSKLTWTPERRAQASAKMIGTCLRKGTKASQETRILIGKNSIEVWSRPGHKDRMRGLIAIATKNTWENPEIRARRIAGLKGHAISEQTREKISKAQIGRPRPASSVAKMKEAGARRNF